MPRVIVDLDVVTIAVWREKRDPRQGSSRKFIERVERGEFSLLVPDTFFEIIGLWEYGELMKRIRDWYARNAEALISSDGALKNVAEGTKIGEDALVEKSASGADIKREDAFLVLIGIGGDAEFIVTWNKAHLRDKREKIEEVGRKLGLRVPRIAFPTEI